MPASPWSETIRPSVTDPRPDQSFSTTPTLLLGMYRTPENATRAKNPTSANTANTATGPPGTACAIGQATIGSNGQDMGANPCSEDGGPRRSGRHGRPSRTGRSPSFACRQCPPAVTLTPGSIRPSSDRRDCSNLSEKIGGAQPTRPITNPKLEHRSASREGPGRRPEDRHRTTRAATDCTLRKTIIEIHLIQGSA